MEYLYFAFISYSSADARWGKRVQRKLEGYRMPATLCSEHGWERNPMKPVFFAPTDIQPGDLDEELKARLRASKNLIVIASPRSAQSEWVAREIAYFHSLPQGGNIYFFIVDGQPMSGDPQTECYNPVIHELGMGEPLGVNIHERIFRRSWLNHERAYIQLITKLLGIEFDDLWQRHRRRQRRHVTLLCIGCVLITLSTTCLVRANGSTDVNLTLVEDTPHNKYLEPRKNAVVKMWIDGEERCDSLKCEEDSTMLFRHVPRRMLGEKVRVRFECFDFHSVDTTILLKEHMTFSYRRDASVFGHVEFTLLDAKGCPVTGNSIAINGFKTVSDKNGHVILDVPIEQQRCKYYLISETPLQDSVIVMPCTESVIIKTKN